VTDDHSLSATPYNSPTCFANGTYLDGSNYFRTTSWSFGGATSFEVYVAYKTLQPWSRIFDFGSGVCSYNFLLANVNDYSNVKFDSESTFLENDINCF